MVVTSFDKEVESILADRLNRRRGVPSYQEYLVKWKNAPDIEASQEPKDSLWQFKDHMERFKLKGGRGRRELEWGRVLRLAQIAPKNPKEIFLPNDLEFSTSY